MIVPPPGPRSATASWSDSPIGVQPLAEKVSIAPSISPRSIGPTGMTNSESTHPAVRSSLDARWPYTRSPTSVSLGIRNTISRSAAFASSSSVTPPAIS